MKYLVFSLLLSSLTVASTSSAQQVSSGIPDSLVIAHDSATLASRDSLLSNPENTAWAPLGDCSSLPHRLSGRRSRCAESELDDKTKKSK